MKSTVTDILWTLLIAAAAYFALHLSILTIKVDQPSMKPSIEPGWWIILSKISYRISDPQRGEIIVFHAPEDIEPGKDFIKRIIGKPGDIVEIKKNTVFVNDVALDEPYARELHYTMTPVEIPEDQYFVLGDNRDISVDSHFGWLVPRESIVGKAWVIMWPPSEWGGAPNYLQTAPDGIEDAGFAGPELSPWKVMAQ